MAVEPVAYYRSGLALLKHVEARQATQRRFTFAGGAANVLLARILEAELGERVTARNTSIVFREKAAESRVAVMKAIVQLANEDRPNQSDAIAYSQSESRRRFSKFEPCVPDRLLANLLAERSLDLVGARKALDAFRTTNGAFFPPAT